MDRGRPGKQVEPDEFKRAYRLLLAVGHSYRDLDPLSMREIVDLGDDVALGRKTLATIDLVAHYEAVKGR